jgi:hypothetical protein
MRDWHEWKLLLQKGELKILLSELLINVPRSERGHSRYKDESLGRIA